MSMSENGETETGATGAMNPGTEVQIRLHGRVLFARPRQQADHQDVVKVRIELYDASGWFGGTYIETWVPTKLVGESA